jgi:8-oxo-dGTP pyrophosphatase MutT (NUDIX family)
MDARALLAETDPDFDPETVPIDDAAVRAAVEEAGYAVAAPAGQALPLAGQTSGCGCGCS